MSQTFFFVIANLLFSLERIMKNHVTSNKEILNMTMLCVMGTHSCATMSIGSFKGENKDLNEKYKADKSTFDEGLLKSEETVKWFRDNIMMPVRQGIGRTANYPFQALMDTIDATDLKPKACFATLNQSQYQLDNHYWEKELLRNGFVKFGEVVNNWGSMNHLYVRNLKLIPVQEGEALAAA